METIDCKHKISWDYLGWAELSPKPKTANFVQDDWNQTIVTAINKVSSEIHKNNLRGSASKILVHPNLKPFFKTLFHYNENENKLVGRYDVEFNDEVQDNIIFVYRNLEIHEGTNSKRLLFAPTGEPNYGEAIVHEDGNLERELVNFGEISFKLYDMDDEENHEWIEEFSKLNKGFVSIERYVER